MTDKALAKRRNLSFLLPPVIAEMGDDAGRAFIDFFTAQIRNANTRAAYGHNVGRFLDWIIQDLNRRGRALPTHQRTLYARRHALAGFLARTMKSSPSCGRMRASQWQ